MKISDRGLELVKEFEGFASRVYDDVGGKPTIGYGHLIRSGESFGVLSESEATELLCRDMEAAEAVVNDAVEVPLTSGQFSALCSLTFNIGSAAFLRSTLLRKLNAGDYVGALAEFPKWSKVGSKQVPGLLRRRVAEQVLFQS